MESLPSADQPDPSATGAYRSADPRAERFASGTLLAGRYRVVAALGRGGMGEVYRADDLTLGQPVALKFLPQHLASDPDRLARFRKEVAAARKVSHPNVCRVYDITEHDGQSFLTMEFVDGEDLSSLLKRVGRLSEEKGVEIARQLCSALAAVHEEGLLHRDLKPANVMLDGRGKVRLTDFGLAAAAEDLSATDVRSGTPLYQAPEQLSGKEVTARSDLFALGLVLYELFTGKRAFAGSDRATPPSKPSSHVLNLNPAVERVILRCLESDPANRPHSATEALAALPGGDPLAAALAAGETPSPQLVADAGAVGLIKPWVGALLLGGIVVGLALIAVLNDSMRTRRGRLPAPEQQASTARTHLAGLGFRNPPKDRTYWYQSVPEPSQPGGWGIIFKYRESPGWLIGTQSAGIAGNPGAVTSDDPPPTRSGMVEVSLDSAGRLLSLSAVPEGQPTSAKTAPNWAALFDSAGLDLNRFTPSEPQVVPPHPFDHWQGWQGEDPSRPGKVLRVEAATWRDRPVWFHTQIADESGPEQLDEGTPTWFWIFVGLTLGAGTLLAGRNLLRGRSDTRGAIRIGIVLAAAGVFGWVIGGRHVPAFDPESRQLMAVAGVALFNAGGAVVYYLAVEPYLRRRWPIWLTGLGRVLAGRWRDPRVSRDVLVGIFTGVALATILRALVAYRVALGLPLLLAGGMFKTVAFGLFDEADVLVTPLLFALLDATVVFVLFLLFRKRWLYLPAAVAYFALRYTGGPGVFLLPPGAMAAGVLSGVLMGVWWLIVLVRFGVWTTTCARFALGAALLPSLTWDVSAWYFWTGAGVMLILLALALGAAYIATGRKRLFAEGFFGDD